MTTRTDIVTLNSAQRHVFDELLSTGTSRPYSPDGIAERLSAHIKAGTRDALALWSESSLWLSKSQIMTALQCEGQTVSYAISTDVSEMGSRTVAGIVAHQAIQIAYTHPGHPVRRYVDWALEMAAADEIELGRFWEKSSPARQSEVVALTMERVSGFLDSWPELQDEWEPRFEVPFQTKIGKLTLAGRADLLLGRPRPPRQTMLLCDLKTGSLHPHHELEAAFYALLVTLRTGVAPYRSVVYSIASGDWTDNADVSEASLFNTADKVIDAVCSYVEVLTASREPELSPGFQCQWCPAKDTCPAAAMAAEVEGIIPSRGSVILPESLAIPGTKPGTVTTVAAPSVKTAKLTESFDPEDDMGPFAI